MKKQYSKIEFYNLLRKLRDKFKIINQISYNLAQIDRRFPIDELDDQSLPNLLEVYKDFYKELEKAQIEILSILNEQNEISPNKD